MGVRDRGISYRGDESEVSRVKKCKFCEIYRFAREVDSRRPHDFHHIYKVILVSIGRKKVFGKYIDSGRMTYSGCPARFCPQCGKKLGTITKARFPE